jgi:predicted CopG family antitoxin
MKKKKLTLTIDEEVYENLRRTMGPRKISQFIEELIRPHIIHPDLESEYAAMAQDKVREKDALEWVENTLVNL